MVMRIGKVTADFYVALIKVLSFVVGWGHRCLLYLKIEENRRRKKGGGREG